MTITSDFRSSSSAAQWSARARAGRVVGAVAISAIGWAGALRREAEMGLWMVLLDLGLGVAAFVVMTQRRRRPVATASAIAVLSTVSITASGPALLAVASLATRRRVREVAPVAALTVACWVGFELITANPAPVWQSLSFSLVVVAGAVGCGAYVGTRVGVPAVDRPGEANRQP